MPADMPPKPDHDPDRDMGRAAVPGAAGAAIAPLLIYGVGGPLTADIEESCARQGRRIAALVRNRPGECLVLEPALLIEAAALDAALRQHPFLCPLFTPANRRTAAAEAAGRGLAPAAALVDPTAVVAASTRLGAGSYVNAGCIIGAAGAIGDFVMINRGASLGHHARVGDFASIGPGVVIAGQVEIGPGALLGAGVIVGPAVRIGEGARVAPGTVVNRDLPPGSLATGNPMRVVRAAEPDTGAAAD